MARLIEMFRIGARRLVFGALSLAATLLGLAPAMAAEIAEPHPWQLGMQPAATPVREHLSTLHNELLVIITVITIFVLALLVYVIYRFDHRRNPVPSRTSHNTVIEVLWTVVPVLILVIIAIPSFKLMYYMDTVPDSSMTVKVTGHQWYWSYEMPDQGVPSFDSNIIPASALKPGQRRLLEVDNPLVVPINTNIRVQIAGSDVMHSWFVPSIGIQQYAVIGRLNEAWMNVEREGTYYGECNQICGVNHAYMPIVVQAVSKEAFQRYVDEKKKAASIGGDRDGNSDIHHQVADATSGR